jgi:uncharacterized protein (TIGR03000 family)
MWRIATKERTMRSLSILIVLVFVAEVEAAGWGRPCVNPCYEICVPMICDQVISIPCDPVYEPPVSACDPAKNISTPPVANPPVKQQSPVLLDNEPSVPSIPSGNQPRAKLLDDDVQPTSLPQPRAKLLDDVRIKLTVPADATVYINGEKTKSRGTKREYISRAEAGKMYKYDVVMVSDGQKYAKTIVAIPGKTVTWDSNVVSIHNLANR